MFPSATIASGSRKAAVAAAIAVASASVAVCGAELASVLGAPGTVELQSAKESPAVRLHAEQAPITRTVALTAPKAVLGRVDVAQTPTAPVTGTVLPGRVITQTSARKKSSDGPVLLDTATATTKPTRRAGTTAPTADPEAMQASVQTPSEQPAPTATTTVPAQPVIEQQAGELNTRLLQLQIACQQATDPGSAALEICRRARGRSATDGSDTTVGPPGSTGAPDARTSPDIPAPPPASLYVRTGR